MSIEWVGVLSKTKGKNHKKNHCVRRLQNAGTGERLQMGFPGLFKKYQVEFPGVD